MTAVSVAVSVVVPLYCESGNVERGIGAIRDAANRLGVNFEIIAVDDGSTDDTWQTIRRVAGLWPELRACALTRNFGKDAAILAGLERARGQAVIVMDGDLQHPPGIIPQMYQLWRNEGFEVVSGVKRESGASPTLRRFCAGIYYRIFGWLAGTRLHGSSDFKLLDRKVVTAFLQLPEHNTFFRGLIPWLGFRQTAIDFTTPERTVGQSRWTGFGLARMALNSLTSFTAIPLQVVTLLGIVFLGIAAVMAAQTLYLKVSGQAVEGFTTVILLLLLTNSAIMISLGIIGQYLAKIYDEAKRRPRYLIRDEL